MATKKVYDACCRLMRRHGECVISTKGLRRVYKPNMKFLFGKKELVSEVEFLRCSESEKRRHLMENRVLRSTYIELYSHLDKLLYGTTEVAHAQDID